MLDLGFLPDVERILNHTPAGRQTMLFSATMPSAVVALARRFMTQPTHIRASEPDDTGATVRATKQFVYRAHALDKIEMVARILQSRGRGLTMIFARTKRTVANVAEQLEERGFAAAAIHGDLGQGAREQALRAFRNGKVDVLVATDVAARGIDVDDVTHVINYACPEDEKTYLHRIGRTGRAGNTGVAVTFVDWDDLHKWMMINKTLDLGIPEAARDVLVVPAPVHRPRHPRGHQGHAPPRRAHPRRSGRRGGRGPRRDRPRPARRPGRQGRRPGGRDGGRDSGRGGRDSGRTAAVTLVAAAAGTRRPSAARRARPRTTPRGPAATATASRTVGGVAVREGTDGSEGTAAADGSAAQPSGDATAVVFAAPAAGADGARRPRAVPTAARRRDGGPAPAPPGRPRSRDAHRPGRGAGTGARRERAPALTARAAARHRPAARSRSTDRTARAALPGPPARCVRRPVRPRRPCGGAWRAVRARASRPSEGTSRPRGTPRRPWSRARSTGSSEPSAGASANRTERGIGGSSTGSP